MSKVQLPRPGVRDPALAVTVVELGDGGQVDVIDAELVALGDAGALTARGVRYTHPGDSVRPACEIEFEVRGGAPTCTRIVLEADTENSLRAKDLRVISLEDLRDDVFTALGVYRPNPTGNGWRLVRGSGPRTADRREVEKATSRRKLTPELLAEVAGVWLATDKGYRLAAVRERVGVAERQALRYVAAAREKGLIE